jgi:hypothetical protein
MHKEICITRWIRWIIRPDPGPSLCLWNRSSGQVTRQNSCWPPQILLIISGDLIIPHLTLLLPHPFFHSSSSSPCQSLSCKCPPSLRCRVCAFLLPDSIRRSAMWRRAYLFLVLVRLYFALSPSYLHPDENFQGPEVIAGMCFLCSAFAMRPLSPVSPDFRLISSANVFPASQARSSVTPSS